ncbi:hypothetical protein BBO99_00002391 [Phytophthora kernoviae]|uniref:B9 domain-containing protein 2 n=2 Tax=Phytophthora kernoviae TaxID=325452 RepID=A0A421EU50_9STRA|nr:hypothetical protein G195_002727 [Phytophthora kernoviae 00238/432]KAG2531971.1 hypothetical protein JM16_000630 [Phytophthora kernoviae]KAG2532281.1 hypothetical protein JM18_000660 [Phytophthora kernoviae]RLN02105.1 hypothetical protein BBI17_002216 [Phytophthora kernoviae]RLN83094.1 hypothetical protein BBO99_00002391 [Phytophthora kernoviae]
MQRDPEIMSAINAVRVLSAQFKNVAQDTMGHRKELGHTLFRIEESYLKLFEKLLELSLRLYWEYEHRTETQRREDRASIERWREQYERKNDECKKVNKRLAAREIVHHAREIELEDYRGQLREVERELGSQRELESQILQLQGAASVQRVLEIKLQEDLMQLREVDIWSIDKGKKLSKKISKRIDRIEQQWELSSHTLLFLSNLPKSVVAFPFYSLEKVITQIEAIYDDKFASDKVDEADGVAQEEMPRFICEYFLKTHGLRQDAEIGLYRFLVSVKNSYQRNSHVEHTTAIYDGRTLVEIAGNRLAVRAEMRRAMLATVHIMGELMGASGLVYPEGQGVLSHIADLLSLHPSSELSYFCKWRFALDNHVGAVSDEASWKVVRGETHGQTQVHFASGGQSSMPDLQRHNSEQGGPITLPKMDTVWAHPIDLHIAVSKADAWEIWPRLEFQVWSTDCYQLEVLRGVASVPLPMATNEYVLDVPLVLERPKTWLAALAQDVNLPVQDRSSSISDGDHGKVLQGTGMIYLRLAVLSRSLTT